MPVKIRLTRMGKKKQPSYRVVVMDSRKPRDGEYIEQIGFYDPRQDPSLIEIDNDRALEWLRSGAQPTDRARKLLEISGAWTRFRIAKGDIHTVGSDTRAAPAPVAAAPVVLEEAAPAVEETATQAEVAAAEVPSTDMAESPAGETAATLEADTAEAAADEPAIDEPAIDDAATDETATGEGGEKA